MTDSTTDEEIVFLSVDVVLALHQRQIDRYGGTPGLRDRGLLESAVAQPRTSFGGTYAHDGVFAMAAAYLFHIVSNHPFVDGNKRTGLLATQVFLHLNGIALLHESDAFYLLTMGVAEGRIGKMAVATELERIARSKTVRA
ncbi:MAG: type II toxin-antitoxin system death-on-curing family toxin [Polyangiaceae bacterium]|nr:type II toxin-antitoxin system death-on-curing family toxin [Polyangiaceae bacterium]